MAASFSKDTGSQNIRFYKISNGLAEMPFECVLIEAYILVSRSPPPQKKRLVHGNCLLSSLDEFKSKIKISMYPFRDMPTMRHCGIIYRVRISL